MVGLIHSPFASGDPSSDLIDIGDVEQNLTVSFLLLV